MKRQQDDNAAAEEAELSGVERVRKRREERRAKRLAKRAAIVCGVSAVIIGSYAAGFTYFSDHLLPNTKVCGLDVSLMSEDELKSALTNLHDTYSIAVSGDDISFDVPGDDIKFSFDVDEAVRFAFTTQDKSSWPAAIFTPTERMPKVTFDQKALDKIVKKEVKAFNKGAVAPVAATPVLNTNASHFNVREEKPGTQIEAASVKDKVTAAASAATPSVKLDASDLIPPAHTADSEEMAAALEKANAVFEQTIPLTRGEKTLFTVEADTFKEWLVVFDDLTVGLDEEKTATWLDTICWHYLDYATDDIIYTVDAKATAHTMSEALRKGDGSSAEVTYVLTPCYVDRAHSISKATWDAEMGRYIDVDKKAQVATLFDDTGRVIFETIVTTGNEASNDGTPTGTYDVYDKVKDTMLIGLDNDGDGKPDYEHHVNYWMPFAGTIGLHDADWRTTYGGSEYLEHGSGGCVNLPQEAAGVLFNIIHIDEIVYVHN